MKSKLISIFVILISLLCIQSLVYAADDNSSSNVTWTDFSKAKFEIKIENERYAHLYMTNVKEKDERLYYYCITANNTKPTIDINNIDINNIGIADNSILNFFYFNQYMDITDYVELNQDLYLWIIETRYDSIKESNYVVEGKKLERPKYPTYADIFSDGTRITFDHTIIDFNVPWDNHSRKINLKIGIIDDITILNKIKNKENDAFQKLLEYSKKSNAIYNKQLTSSKASYYLNRI